MTGSADVDSTNECNKCGGIGTHEPGCSPAKRLTTAEQVAEAIWRLIHIELENGDLQVNLPQEKVVALINQYAIQGAEGAARLAQSEIVQLRVSLAGSEGAVRANGTTIDSLRAERDKYKAELEALDKDYGNLVKEQNEQAPVQNSDLQKAAKKASAIWKSIRYWNGQSEFIYAMEALDKVLDGKSVAESQVRIDAELKHSLAKSLQLMVAISQRMLSEVEDAPLEKVYLCEYEDGNENECGKPRPCPVHDVEGA